MGYGKFVRRSKDMDVFMFLLSLRTMPNYHNRKRSIDFDTLQSDGVPVEVVHWSSAVYMVLLRSASSVMPN